jgi:hypothetical protein
MQQATSNMQYANYNKLNLCELLIANCLLLIAYS